MAAVLRELRERQRRVQIAPPRQPIGAADAFEETREDTSYYDRKLARSEPMAAGSLMLLIGGFAALLAFEIVIAWLR